MQQKPFLKVNGSGWKIALTAICAITVLAQFILILSWCLRLLPTPWHRNIITSSPSTTIQYAIAPTIQPFTWISVPSNERHKIAPHTDMMVHQSEEIILEVECPRNATITITSTPSSESSSSSWSSSFLSSSTINFLSSLSPFSKNYTSSFNSSLPCYYVIDGPSKYSNGYARSLMIDSMPDVIVASVDLDNPNYEQLVAENTRKWRVKTEKLSMDYLKLMAAQPFVTGTFPDFETLKYGAGIVVEPRTNTLRTPENRLAIENRDVNNVETIEEKKKNEMENENVENSGLTKIEIILAGKKIFDFFNGPFQEKKTDLNAQIQYDEKDTILVNNDEKTAAAKNDVENKIVETESLGGLINEKMNEYKAANRDNGISVSRRESKKEPNAKRIKILQLGLKGAAFNNFFARNFTQHDIIVLEPEPIVKYLAQKYFALVENAYHRVLVGEPLHALAELARNADGDELKFDLIAVDICGGGGQNIFCPTDEYRRHLGVAYLQRLLASNGTLVINVFSAEAGKDKKDYTIPSSINEITRPDAELLTFYLRYFPHCYFVCTRMNKILTCSKARNASSSRMSTARYTRLFEAAKLPRSFSGFNDLQNPRVYDTLS